MSGTIGIEFVHKYHGRSTDLTWTGLQSFAFYQQLSGVRKFAYGDDLAWDQDFEESGIGNPSHGTDSFFVDNVDIVYFSGHGSANGPFFGVADKDSGRARPGEMRLGNRQLEWIVFDACEVLEFNGVFNRWGWPVMRGLHHILGFHTTSTDEYYRGQYFAVFLNSGDDMALSWRLACMLTEDSSTHFAYLRAGSDDCPTHLDHWHGKGFVSPDPSNPEFLVHVHGPC